MTETSDKTAFVRLLEQHGLKKTKPRLSVLEILASRTTAISQPELEEFLGNEIDRVTLYRTLKTFEDNGILHKIIDFNGTANYASCDTGHCSAEAHNDQHVHFNCTICLNVYCLESLDIPKLAMPGGFVASSTHLLVYGICEDCTKKQAHL